MSYPRCRLGRYRDSAALVVRCIEPRPLHLAAVTSATSANHRVGTRN